MVALLSLYRFWQSGLNMYAPVNSLFINGLRNDLSDATFNVFDLLAEGE